MASTAAQPAPKVELSVHDLVGVLGVPGYILQTFFPTLAHTVQRRSRVFKTLAQVFIVLSTTIAAGKYLRLLISAILDHCVSSVCIYDTDTLNSSFRNFLQQTTCWPTGRFEEAHSVSHARRIGLDALWWSFNRQSIQNIQYYPEGTTYFWQRRLFWTFEVKEEDQITTRICTLGFSNEPIKALLQKIWQRRLRDRASRLIDIYRSGEDGRWDHVTTKHARSLSTIDMDRSMLDRLVSDIDKFLSTKSEEKFTERGIAYRRGYLFHGPPGTGKTSVAMAIAGRFQLDVFIASLAGPQMTDDKVAGLFGQLDKPSLLLLEDIDSAGVQRNMNGVHNDPDNARQRTQITLSGLLNALDGIAAPENCILIMTTNFRDLLDPALTRPGRVDFELAFQHVDRVIARNAFVRLMASDALPHSELEELAERFAAGIPEGTLSYAELQRQILAYNNSTLATLSLEVERDVNRTVHMA